MRPDRRSRPSLVPLVALLVALAFLSTACAGTIRDQVRSSALVVGETALTADQLERDLYAMGLPQYGEAQHREAGKAIIIMLEAAQVYERAARAWPETMPTLPRDVWEAQAKALAAIDAVDRIVAPVPEAKKLRANLAKVRQQIGG